MLRLRHMSQDIRNVISPFTEILAFGEPTHLEHAHIWIRNELFEQLAGLGFRSIALETCRVRGLIVDDYVKGGPGDLDTVMKEGFSHRFGEWPANRELVAWMREYNQDKPREERLTFHGFDFQAEMTSAPSPRPYLEHARDYLGLDVDLTVEDDEKWSRDEAILDLTKSPGKSEEARRLREIGQAMLAQLHTSRTPGDAWNRAETHLTAGLSLLRYHKQAAEPLELKDRLTTLCAMRDGVMARNLLEIRRIEAGRGPTFVFAHNGHLQRTLSSMEMAGERIEWLSAGALVAPILGDQYTFVAGTLGRNDTFGLGEPDKDTFEGSLQGRFTTWGVTTELPTGTTRTDTKLEMGYFPLDQHLLDGVDAVLHVRVGRPVTR